MVLMCALDRYLNLVPHLTMISILLHNLSSISVPICEQASHEIDISPKGEHVLNGNAEDQLLCGFQGSVSISHTYLRRPMPTLIQPFLRVALKMHSTLCIDALHSVHFEKAPSAEDSLVNPWVPGLVYTRNSIYLKTYGSKYRYCLTKAF